MQTDMTMQAIHELVMLYLSKHPELLGQSAPPETYPVVYGNVMRRMRSAASTNPPSV